MSVGQAYLSERVKKGYTYATMPDDIAQQIIDKLTSLESGQVALQGSVASLEKGQAVLQGSVASLEKGQKQIIERQDRVETLAEDDRSRFDGLLESVSAIAHQTARIPAIEATITELRSDSKVIKAAVNETNRDLQRLDERVTMLEVKA